MRAQVSAASKANAQFLDQGGILHPTLRQVVNPFGIAMQFELIKTGRVLEQLGSGCELLLQVGDALAERETQGQFDKANLGRRPACNRGSKTDSCEH